MRTKEAERLAESENDRLVCPTKVKHTDHTDINEMDTFFSLKTNK